MESTLQSTLLLAQSAADQAKDSSKKEGELIVKNAMDKAAEIIRNAESSALEVDKKLEMLKQEYISRIGINKIIGRYFPILLINLLLHTESTRSPECSHLFNHYF